MKVVISSGHGLKVPGGSGYVDEVEENRRVVNKVAALLSELGVAVEVFHDDVSTTQKQNLNRIVNFHNSETRDLDVSVHFNSNEDTSSPMGTECLYVTQDELADSMSRAIAAASGLKNRGPKERNDLFFLNNTEEPAILIEVCFVDSSADVEIYQNRFIEICQAIANVISGNEPTDEGFRVLGKASTFGGPSDSGISPSEGLAFITDISRAPQLFLPYQPAATTGLARRLNPYVAYIACRWDYAKTSKQALLDNMALVRALKTDIALKAFPADWGPSADTGRVADLSPSLMDNLGIQTDDEVEVIFPFS